MHTEFLAEYLKERYHVDIVSVNGKMVLKLILKLGERGVHWIPLAQTGGQ